MVNFFHRTSTFQVYELAIFEEKQDLEFICSKMIDLGHKRTRSDIKNMVAILNHFGLFESKFKEKAKLLMKDGSDSTSKEMVLHAQEFVDEMMERGLLIRPFLEAVGAYPNKNRTIQYELVKRCEKHGFYDQRIGDDISAAMRNFTSMLNLTEPYTKRGRYELSPLGEQVVRRKRTIYERVKCDQGEPCRKVCPTNAISAFRINLNCIACGLCVDACPYGALTIDCEEIPELKYDPEICKKSLGKPNKATVCDTGKLLGDELSQQRWIKQILKIVGITSEIPGVGEYPDIVTLEDPAFIEVKKTRITKRGKERVIEQVIRYADEILIDNTIDQLRHFSDLKWKKPEYMIVTSPSGGQEKEVIKTLKKEIPDKIIGFIPTSSFYSLAQLYFETEVNDRKIISLEQLIQ